MEKILERFNRFAETQWNPSQKLLNESEGIEAKLESLRLNADEEKSLFDLVVTAKLGLSDEAYRLFINTCAANKVTFNTHEKRSVKRSIQQGEYELLKKLVATKKSTDQSPIGSVILTIQREARSLNAHKALSDFLSRNKSKRDDILESLYANFFFYHFERAELITAFNADSMPDLHYYDYLRHSQPYLFKRDNAAYLIELKSVPEQNFAEYRDWALSQIAAAYEKLSNHCYLFISIQSEDKGQMWRLYGDLVLYAEKFLNVELPKTYFKSAKVKEDTTSYITELQNSGVDFSTAQIGFSYEDCFVLAADQDKYSKILLAFVKNDSDETKIPCPACRSLNVRANSYPKLGIRSWECWNPLCPDRSLYGRGKRYSFYSILRQESINDLRNLISEDHINKWKFDITYGEAQAEYQLIAEHYSLYDENIVIVDGQPKKRRFIVSGRHYNSIKELTTSTVKHREFIKGDIFQRYIIDRRNISPNKYKNIAGDDEVMVYCGDAYEVLQQIEDNSVDVAVTSPPYYNAREYSNWNNMYCYLYDMYNIYKALFKKLKPGAIFLFNIFDYFDNERTIVYSDMGKKRVILGAYSLDMFQRIGYQVRENIIWDKGEIEGKRFFNQGNDFPYYQRPFNSWEHIFVLQKPPISSVALPQILREKPVLKMFNGKNILGHTAPYPKAIPELLVRHLDSGVVLDPFSGSMTTGRVAYEAGLKSINIELSREYCKLGLKLWKEQTEKLTLFDLAVDTRLDGELEPS